jgi:hypothetical protein
LGTTGNAGVSPAMSAARKNTLEKDLRRTGRLRRFAGETPRAPSKLLAGFQI